jgi:3-hydroxyisobutyrate dehydrogenase-like beta-hydroxyacid dehydrogenase
MTTIETSEGRRELQIGFVGLGKMGRPTAIRVKTTVHGLWGRDIVAEALL